MTSPKSFTCVIFALAREAKPFLRIFPPRPAQIDAPCWAHWCGAESNILVLQTGVGAQRTQKALQWLCGCMPGRLISAGFAGGLSPNALVGSVLLTDAVLDADGRGWPIPEAAGISLPGALRGRLLTAARLIGEPDEKQRLAQTFDVTAVDMETAGIAAACAADGIPFLSVRAISDDVRTPLSPRLLRLLWAERVSTWRLMLTAASSPTLLAECWRLARNTRLAAERLAVALSTILRAASHPRSEAARESFDVCRA